MLPSPPADTSTNGLFQSRYESECQLVHRFMAWIMAGQWLLGLIFVICLSPMTWIGERREIHIHVWAAVLIGTSLSGFGILWMSLYPRRTHTRHVIAAVQMLWSALLIHLSGGRIETHFHVFASLAILSTYRDWTVLVTATLVVAVDHCIRGIFYPLSVFGIVTESPYRWIEHAAWVLFEFSVLAPSCYRLRNEVWELCARQTEIEEAKRSVDLQVTQRTRELTEAYDLLADKTAELEIAALHDGLTGLPNRVKFTHRLEEALGRRIPTISSTAVLLIDLDQFKYINDSMGHPAGDELLRVISRRLTTVVGNSGLVARFGGDEFAVVFDRDASPQGVEALSAALREAIATPVELDGSVHQVTSSIGVAFLTDAGACSDGLIRNADIALYRAKADGRDCVRLYTAEMDEKVRGRRQWELMLRGAVERGEFVIYYQPSICPDSLRICSFEALLRWQHPEFGLVPPDRFIPLAEETGLITPIGDWVLMEACREAMTWPDDIGVAVNVSAVQFHGGRVAESVARAIADSAIDPRRLEVEITESVLIGQSVDALDQLHALHELGVRIALDDFGTGYSSLGYLRQFPFDKLKMDKSFVQNLDQADALAIVRTIANLGKCLGITTTAEGIETEQQLRHVVGEGFTQVQGYLYGRPLPANQLAIKRSPLNVAKTEFLATSSSRDYQATAITGLLSCRDNPIASNPKKIASTPAAQ